MPSPVSNAVESLAQSRLQKARRSLVRVAKAFRGKPTQYATGSGLYSVPTTYIVGYPKRKKARVAALALVPQQRPDWGVSKRILPRNCMLPRKLRVGQAFLSRPLARKLDTTMATKTMNRDAKTGQIVTPAYVKSHPATTTIEHRKVVAPAPSKPSGGKKGK